MSSKLEVALHKARVAREALEAAVEAANARIEREGAAIEKLRARSESAWEATSDLAMAELGDGSEFDAWYREQSRACVPLVYEPEGFVLDDL